MDIFEQLDYLIPWISWINFRERESIEISMYKVRADSVSGLGSSTDLFCDSGQTPSTLRAQCSPS